LGVSAQKTSGAASGLFGFYGFLLFVAPIPAFGPATDGRAETRFYLRRNIEIPAKWITWREYSIEHTRLTSP
jgi:hypothetical protein